MIAIGGRERRRKRARADLPKNAKLDYRERTRFFRCNVHIGAIRALAHGKRELLPTRGMTGISRKVFEIAGRKKETRKRYAI